MLHNVTFISVDLYYNTMAKAKLSSSPEEFWGAISEGATIDFGYEEEAES